MYLQHVCLDFEGGKCNTMEVSLRIEKKAEMRQGGKFA
jgi:hypothetical protein